MEQLNNITFDENGKILFVHNRICLKLDCKSSKLYQKTILLMTPEEQYNLKKQILVPSFIFSQFETKSTGQKLIGDEYSNKVALCFQHLTGKTQKYYLKYKTLPDWAQLKQHAKKVGKVYLPDPKRAQNYYWSGHRYSRQALYKINLFDISETKTVETKDVASLDAHMTIETEHIVLPVGPISETSQNFDAIQFLEAEPIPSTSAKRVKLHKEWHQDQLRSETDSDESDTTVMVQAKKPKITDSNACLILQKDLGTKVQVAEVKIQKLTEDLELNKLQTVKLLAEVEQMKLLLGTKESHSLTESTSLLQRAQQSITLTSGEIILLIMINLFKFLSKP